MSLVDRLALLWSKLIGLCAVIAPLMGRLVIGYAFTQTGLGKWRHFDNTVGFFTQIGIPAPAANAAFIATLELVGGWALIFGLGTRLFSLLLSSTMVVALLTADRDSFIGALTGTSDSGLLDVTPVPFLITLLLLAAFGAGPLAIDYFFGRHRESTATAAIRRVA